MLAGGKIEGSEKGPTPRNGLSQESPFRASSLLLAEENLENRLEFTRPERLLQKCGYADMSGFLDFAFIVLSRKHHNGDKLAILVFLYCLSKLNTVHTGHIQIGKYQIISVVLNKFAAFRATFDASDVIAERLEKVAQ